MSPDTIALLAALPWIVIPLLSAIRLRDSRSISVLPADPPADPPRVSVIIPARNEARNIEKCVRSVLATSYPDIEVLVIDDQSTDGTGEIATDIQRGDPRVLVFTTPSLPRGWFGKQWACWTGASRARGDILCFTDADTVHGPELLTRSVNAMLARDADLFTVMGKQEMVTLWEKLIQPQIFTMLNFWYGGTESVTRSRRTWRKIANGQFLMTSRAAYDDAGGHEAVRGGVAEDLMLAQLYHRLGRRVVFMDGREHLSTRMYTSLRELIAGWGKNVFAGGIRALPKIPGLRFLFPLALITPPLVVLAPSVILLLAVAGLLSGAVLLWAIVATAATLLAWIVIYMDEGESPLLGLLHPVAAAITLFILLRAIARGSRVEWKDRVYRSG
ncbi:MAG TPA: glycosyltransferase family 2 protein [Gemmatimonadaceae bacterium]|nr:glycosyltransferase family 2 protein [Gemmatimonadaceae bacterium]